MNYWLLKSDPETYGLKELVADGSTRWDGIRSYAARIHLRAMKKGDLALFYHSNSPDGVVGTVQIIREHYPDPADKENTWSAIDIKLHKQMKNYVSLEAIKSDKRLKNIILLKIGRLSVMPVTESEYKTILELGGM
ncbi:MAG: EVE domain-containing protein [Bacteroidia bacterium]|nr:EVE domain-containing protein [Bacteroidia bacterium]